MARAARRETMIHDVAIAADASASTVSLVLNGSCARHRIEEDMANRIKETAEWLGHKGSLAAGGRCEHAPAGRGAQDGTRL